MSATQCRFRSSANVAAAKTQRTAEFHDNECTAAAIAVGSESAASRQHGGSHTTEHILNDSGEQKEGHTGL